MGFKLTGMPLVSSLRLQLIEEVHDLGRKFYDGNLELYKLELNNEKGSAKIWLRAIDNKSAPAHRDRIGRNRRSCSREVYEKLTEQLRPTMPLVELHEY